MKGERADVFASVDMEHPESLAKAGKAEAARRVARNKPCTPECGVAALKGASPTGNAFVNFLLGAEGRKILAAHGFAAP